MYMEQKLQWFCVILIYHSDVTRASWNLKSPTTPLLKANSGWHQRKHQSSWLLPFSSGIHCWPGASLALLALCEGNPTVTIGFPSQRASNVQRLSMAKNLHGSTDPNTVIRKMKSCITWSLLEALPIVDLADFLMDLTTVTPLMLVNKSQGCSSCFSVDNQQTFVLLTLCEGNHTGNHQCGFPSQRSIYIDIYRETHTRPFVRGIHTGGSPHKGPCI